jgi:HK97 family phage portal protein
MGIFTRKQKPQVTEQRGIGDNEWTNPIMGTLSLTSFSQYTSAKAMRLSTVYRCVNLISDSVASMPIIPYTYFDRSGKLTDWKYIDYSNNLFNLFNIQPNTVMSANTFKRMIVVNMLLNGNTFVLIDRKTNGMVNTMTLMNSDFMEIRFKGGILTYFDRVNNKTYSSDQMIHIMNYTANGYIGLSTLTHAATTLGIAYSSEEHTNSFFKGGAALAGILRPIAGTNINKQKATDAKASFVSALNSDLQQNTNSIVVLDSGLEYQSITVNPKDSQLLESRAFNVQDICRFFGVPPTMAFSETGKFSTAEQQQIDYLNNTITPLIEKIENELFRKCYLPSEWNSTDLKFDTENLMRTDAASKASYYNTLFRVGGYTVNEIREKLNAGFPVTGGNRAFIDNNVQPTDALISEQTVVSDPSKQIDNNLKQDTTNGNN